MKRLLFIIALFPLLTSGAFAAPPPDTLEKVLLPVTVQHAPGAFGTMWTSELWMVPRSSLSPVIWPLFAPIDCGSVACQNPSLDPIVAAPNVPFQAGFFRTESSEVPGSLLYTSRSDLSVTLFLRESASNQTLQIPVVRQRDTFQTALTLVNLPTSTGQRLTLRAYSIDPELSPRVHLRFLNARTGSVIDERDLALATTPRVVRLGTITASVRPAAVQINDLIAMFPLLATVDTFHLEMSPVVQEQGTPRVWAFVSITDNATQRVTLRTPV